MLCKTNKQTKTTMMTTTTTTNCLLDPREKMYHSREVEGSKSFKLMSRSILNAGNQTTEFISFYKCGQSNSTLLRRKAAPAHLLGRSISITRRRCSLTSGERQQPGHRPVLSPILPVGSSHLAQTSFSY